MKLIPASLAMALATSVLPQPENVSIVFKQRIRFYKPLYTSARSSIIVNVLAYIVVLKI